jgi:hypothetical protein
MNISMNISLDFCKYFLYSFSKIVTGGFLMTPIQDDVKRTLGKFENYFYDIAIGAWQDWLNSSEFVRTRFNRTRANIVWDRMIDRAFNAFVDIPNIEPLERRNTVYFIVDNRVLFRFKKGDLKGLSSNYLTQSAFDFHDHDLPLFGDMNLSRVEVVYVLDRSEIKIENVCIVARNAEKILWSYDLAPQGVVVEMPIPETAVQKSPVVSLVQLADDVKNNSLANN